MHYKKLNEILFGLLDAIKGSIANELYELNHEFISAGEPGIAFENICSYIDDKGLTISRETYDKIEVAGKAMEMDPEEWSFLEKHVTQNMKSQI